MTTESDPPEVKTVLMDCREDFLARFGGKAFSTFDSFSKELQAFEAETGTQFMMKRTCLFNEGTLGREFLIYRYMHYACVRHIRPAKKMGQRAGGTRCSAYFSVGTRKHKLFVRQYDMQHNHPAHLQPLVEPPPRPRLPFNPALPPIDLAGTGSSVKSLDGDACGYEPEFETTVQDCTEDFLRIFPSMSFPTFAELQSKMDEFQLATGNRYVKTNTRRLPPGSPAAETLVYSHLVYICYRYGTQVSEAKQRKLQRTAKIGCRSKIYFYSQDNQLHVRRYDFRHNHEVRPDLVHFPPKRRRTRKEKAEDDEQERKQRLTLQLEQRKRFHPQQQSPTTAPTPSPASARANHQGRMPPISVFKNGDQSTSAAVNAGRPGARIVTRGVREEEGEDDDDLDDDDDDDDDGEGDEEEGDGLAPLYIQTNGYSGNQLLLEEDLRSVVFPMTDFEDHHLQAPPQSHHPHQFHHHPLGGFPYDAFQRPASTRAAGAIGNSASNGGSSLHHRSHQEQHVVDLGDGEENYEDEFEDEEEDDVDEEEEGLQYSADPRCSLMRSLQKHGRPLDSILPRLRPHLQRLGELATSCGPLRFTRRLRELKALGDKWCHENEVAVKRVL